MGNNVSITIYRMMRQNIATKHFADFAKSITIAPGVLIKVAVPLRGPLAIPWKVTCEVSSEQAPCLPVPNVIPAYAIPCPSILMPPVPSPRSAVLRAAPGA